MIIYQVETREAGMTDSTFFTSWNKAMAYTKNYIEVTGGDEWEVINNERGFFSAEKDDGYDTDNVTIYKVAVH